jgi:hypothetical protein
MPSTKRISARRTTTPSTNASTANTNNNSSGPSSEPSQTGSRAGLVQPSQLVQPIHSMILGKLEKFRGKPEENVERWIGEYENHALVNRWDDSVKAIQIGCYLGKTAKAFYGTLDPVEKRDYTQVIAKLLGYFKHTSSSHYFYKKIRERTQQNNETVDQYAFSLATLFKGLNRTITEEEKIDHFTQGLKDDSIRTALFENQPETFESAVKKARKKEMCKEVSAQIKEYKFNKQYLDQIKELQEKIKVIENKNSSDSDRLKESKKKEGKKAEKQEEQSDKYRKYDNYKERPRERNYYRENDDRQEDYRRKKR